MLYKITKQYGMGTEIIAGSFSILNEAQQFMQHEAQKDAQLKIQVIYRLYEFDEIINELNTAQLEQGADHNKVEQGGGGMGQQTGFRPTPLATSLKPIGSIHVVDENKDERKK